MEVRSIRSVEPMDLDCLVIGHGAAGLVCASRLASRGQRVGVVGEGVTATSLSTGCITMIHPVQGEMIDRDSMRSVYPYSLEGEVEDLMMAFEDMYSFLIPGLDQRGLPIRGNPVTVRRMLTSVGTRYQCSIPQMFSLQGRIDRLEESRTSLLGIMGHRDSDPDLAVAMVSSWSDFELDSYWTCPRSLGGRTDLTSGEISRICRRGELIEEVAEAMSELDADLVGIPPIMDLHQYQEGMERLQSLSGRTVFELVTPMSLPGRRLQSALESLASDLGCVMLNGWRATSIAVEGREATKAILESRSCERRISMGSLILASGDTVGGGLTINGQRVEAPLLPMTSEVKDEMAEMDMGGLMRISRSGMRVDDSLRPLIGGDPMLNVAVAGVAIDGFSYPSGAGMGASIFTAWRAADTVMEVRG